MSVTRKQRVTSGGKMRRRAVGGASGGRGRHVSPFLLDKLTARISQVVMESFKNTFTVFEEILVGGDEGARESRFGRGQETDGGEQGGHVEEPHSRLWGSTVFQKERGGRMHI